MSLPPSQSLPDVFILAAGRGRRLRPLTDATPKPLLQVGGQSLLARHLQRLAELGFRRAVVNLAWHGAQIRAHLGESQHNFGLEIRFSQEPEGALSTGGGIVHAMPKIRTDPFWVINADVLCDANYAELEMPQNSDAHLLLVANPAHHPSGDFALQNRRLCLVDGIDSGLKTLTYAGIGCFRKRAFADFSPARFPLRQVIEKAITRGRASGVVHPGAWLDVGSADRLAEARRLFA